MLFALIYPQIKKSLFQALKMELWDFGIQLCTKWLNRLKLEVLDMLFVRFLILMIYVWLLGRVVAKLNTMN